MRVVFAFFLLSTFCSANAQIKDSTTTEILMVSFYLPATSDAERGVYFFYPNDSLVFQPVDTWTKDSQKEKNSFIRNIQIENKIFNDLYTMGWRLILYNPDNNIYFFERPVKT